MCLESFCTHVRAHTPVEEVPVTQLVVKTLAVVPSSTGLNPILLCKGKVAMPWFSPEELCLTD